MLRTLKRPGGAEDFNQLFNVEMGGLGTTDAEEGLQVLDGVPASQKGLPYGPVPVDENGRIVESLISNLFKGPSTVDGDTSIEPNQTKVWYLTAYDCFAQYDISALSGTVYRENNLIYYTAGDTPGNSGFIINGRRVDVVINGSAVLRPSIISPVNDSVDRETSLFLTASDFATIGFPDEHLNTDWEVSTDEDFVTFFVSSYENTSNLTEYEVSGLDSNTYYYARVRYTGATLGQTEWSEVIRFKTRVEIGNPPQILSPASGTTGLSSSQTFVISAFVADNETVQVPQKNANGDVTGYIDAQKTSALVSTLWELSKSEDFAVIDKTTTTAVGVYSWLASGLQANNSYYLRVRYTADYAQPVSANAAGVVQYETVRKEGTWSYPSVYQTMPVFTPNTPLITAPAQNATGLGPSVTISSNIFSSPATDTHMSSDWELSTDPAFSTIVRSSYNDSTNLRSWLATSLLPSVTYYARVRYRGVIGGLSQWSTVRAFSTLASFAPLKPTAAGSDTYGSWGAESGGFQGQYSFTASAFASPIGETCLQTEWSGIGTYSGEKRSVAVSASDSGSMTTQVRYRGAYGGWSAWSNVATSTVSIYYGGA